MTPSDADSAIGPVLLTEARTDSLAELFSRDPERLTEIDLGRLIESLREQRSRWAAAEAEAASRPKGVRAVKTPAARAASLITKAKPEDLGL
jgi:hypothetical protein